MVLKYSNLTFFITPENTQFLTLLLIKCNSKILRQTIFNSTSKNMDNFRGLVARGSWSTLVRTYFAATLLRSQSTLKKQNFFKKSLFSMWNLFFNKNTVFEQSTRLVLCAILLAETLLRKSIAFRFSLTWHQGT